MLQVVERFHGREDHPALVAPLYLAGYCWEQGGRADEAQARFRRALAIRGNRHRP
jgi:Flp pilus assembly protein TadD